MTTQREGGGSSAPPPCRFLRARAAYGRSPLDAAAWAVGPGVVDGCWCLATQEPCGPDDALADRATCRPGRACYAPRAAADAPPAQDPA